MKTRPLILICLVGTFLAGCAVAPKPGMEQFSGMQLPLSAGGGTLTVTSYRENGVELKAHPTSLKANAIRGSITRFIAELPSSVKGPQSRITLAIDSTYNTHQGRDALTAGLVGGLTLGLIGNNILPHHVSSHMNVTLTIGGQGRTYSGTGEAKDTWVESNGTLAGARTMSNTVGRALSQSLHSIATEIRGGHR